VVEVSVDAAVVLTPTMKQRQWLAWHMSCAYKVKWWVVGNKCDEVDDNVIRIWTSKPQYFLVRPHSAVEV
jgi:hypothetical protein